MGLMSYCQTNCEVLAKSGEMNGVIQNKLLAMIINSIDFSICSDKKYSNQQLFLLEFYMILGDLKTKLEEDYGIKIEMAV